MNLDQVVSPFLSEYVKQKFGVVSVEEKKATCGDCLCSKPERGNLPFYRKDLKCCTFQPFLPNYVVGALLEEGSGWVKELIEGKIRQREYAMPMGLFVPVRYQVAFNRRGETDFGNREEFLCPYFDHAGQRCGIWRHRGSVCTSYFCVSDRGEAGLRFWELLGEYLHVCEMVLAQDCVVSMGLPPECIDGQLEYINCATGTDEELASDSMSEVLFQNQWSEWSGSAEDFYRGCSKYVRELGVKGLEELLWEEAGELSGMLREQIAYLKNSNLG
jgi:hypothetical protein